MNRRAWIILGLAGATMGGASCSDGNAGSQAGPVVVKAVDHAMVGHWMGGITVNGARTVDTCLQVEAAADAPRVMLTYFPAGAFYSDCIVMQVTESALMFRFDKGKYDNVFEATLSPDGRELTGTIRVPDGSTSAMQGGTFTLERIPRAPQVPGAMVFSRAMSGQVGAFTLTITLAQADDGRWVAELHVPEQSLNHLPLFNVTERDGMVRGSISIFGPPMEFDMKVSEDRQRLTGSWRSGGSSTPLDLPRIR